MKKESLSDCGVKSMIIEDQVFLVILRAGTIATTSPQRQQGFCSQNPLLALRASAVSQLNCRVNRFQFRPGIIDLHLPVNATLCGVDIDRPRPGFLSQRLDISKATIRDALAR